MYRKIVPSATWSIDYGTKGRITFPTVLKYVASAILVLIVVVAVLGCATWVVAEYGWSFKEGDVTAKWYEPFREWEEPHQMCVYYNKDSTCGQYMFYTTHETDDEDYMVTVKGCQDNRPDKCKTEDWEIQSDVWERINIGDRLRKP